MSVGRSRSYLEELEGGLSQVQMVRDGEERDDDVEEFGGKGIEGGGRSSDAIDGG